MLRLSVGEFKARFSEAIELVKNGEEIEVLYGRVKKPVARLVPYENQEPKSMLGALEGKIWMSDDFEWSDEELKELFGV